MKTHEFEKWIFFWEYIQSLWCTRKFDGIPRYSIDLIQVDNYANLISLRHRGDSVRTNLIIIQSNIHKYIFRRFLIKLIHEKRFSQVLLAAEVTNIRAYIISTVIVKWHYNWTYLKVWVMASIHFLYTFLYIFLTKYKRWLSALLFCTMAKTLFVFMGTFCFIWTPLFYDVSSQNAQSTLEHKLESKFGI